MIKGIEQVKQIIEHIKRGHDGHNLDPDLSITKTTEMNTAGVSVARIRIEGKSRRGIAFVASYNTRGDAFVIIPSHYLNSFLNEAWKARLTWNKHSSPSLPYSLP